AERRVLVVPGVAFGSPDHVRLCFSYARDKLRSALDVIASMTPAAA
ncbi:MAG: aspartate transaminase, partial [Candidatus Dormibacteraeota bacterium]|nr:aspartate transaminase [Candidatus Dormibacteraeota bacterium]